ncbi:MAG: LysR substrate-binding domain-containing protein [Opitutaceae bacterium]
MELRQLRYFVAVAEAGTISRAADRIFLTQPALSRQIKALEEEIGQCLLERKAHSIELTPAGETMLQEAKELLARADHLLERVKAAGKEIRLRIGYAPTLAAGLLSPAVESFRQTHPDARVDLFDRSTEEMLSGLKSGELDAVVTVKGADTSAGVDWTTLIRSPWRLAMGRGHPLAGRRSIEPADLEGESLLAFAQRDYPEYWELLAEWLRAHRLRPRIEAEYDGGESLVTAIESGLGIAMVVLQVAERFPNRVVLKAVSDPPPPLCIAVGRRSKTSAEKPLAVFIEELRRVAKIA